MVTLTVQSKSGSRRSGRVPRSPEERAERARRREVLERACQRFLGTSLAEVRAKHRDRGRQ